MHLEILALLAAFILGFGAVSERIQRSVLTAPMAFTAFGLLLALGAGESLELDRFEEPIRLVAELTLVLVLFTDAARIDLAALRREHGIPIRLLAVGLPLTIVAGVGVGLGLFPELHLWSVVVLATVLAPTDAALGQAVVSDPGVPVKVRQALNVESGLNDGLALPFLLFAVSLCGAQAAGEDGVRWLRFGAEQVTLGPLVGAGVGYLGGRLVVRAARAHWMSEAFQDLSALGLSVLAFAAAELLGGNGFLAAFMAGLTLGNTSRQICTCLYEFAEAQGQLLTLLTFAIYGGVMLAPRLGGIGPAAVVYALASLTVVRMVPVALALIGLGLRKDTLGFLGWFGPRGIASILYGLLILGRVDLPGRETIFTVVVTTVAASVLLHGLTAWPASRWYAARVASMREEAPEMEKVSAMPLRVGSRAE